MLKATDKKSVLHIRNRFLVGPNSGRKFQVRPPDTRS